MEKIGAKNIAGDGIAVDVSGNNEGMIAVGKYILHIMSKEGGYASIQAPEQAPRLHARSSPLQLRMHKLAGFLDRGEDTAHVAEDLVSMPPVEIFGREGFGKTALLQVIASHAVTGSFPDGVVYLEMRDKQPEEMLKELYDAFYETSIPIYPGEAAIRQAIAEKKALVLVDEVRAERRESELRSLVNAATGCSFLFASAEQRLWGDGCTHKLTGLPDEEARQLFERGLGRAAEEAEIPSIYAICTELKGNPLYIQQAAGLAKNDPALLSTIAAQLQETGRAQRLAAALFGSLTAQEERLVSALAALRGAPLDGFHLTKITGDPATPAMLASLQARGIIKAHAPAGGSAGGEAFSLPGPLQERAEQLAAQPPSPVWDFSAVRTALLRYYMRWAQQQMAHPAALLEQAAPLQELLHWASETARWKDVLHLAYLYEKALVLTGRWTTWDEVLRMALKAALELGDQAGQAWVLHQVGTRALCLGENGTARATLVRALRLRQQLNDRAGVEVTRHNLELLIPNPASPASGSGEAIPETGARATRLPPAKWLRWLLGILLGLWGIGAASLGIMTLAPGIFPAAILPSQAEQSPAGSISEIDATPVQPPAADTATASIPSTGQEPQALTSMPPTAAACAPQSSWPVYTIHPGETLFKLAITTSSSEEELQQANCLTSSDVAAGQSLRVPRLPSPQPAAETPATATLTPNLTSTDNADSNQEPPFVITALPTTTVDRYRVINPTPSGPMPDLVIQNLKLVDSVNPGTGDVMDLMFEAVVINTGEVPTNGQSFNVRLFYYPDPKQYPQDAYSLRQGDGISIVEGQIPGRTAKKLDILVKNVDSAWLGKWMTIVVEVNRCAEDGATPCPIPEGNERNNTALFNIFIQTLQPTPEPAPRTGVN